MTMNYDLYLINILSINYYLLTLNSTLSNPDHHSNQNQGHGWENHEAVVEIADLVEGFRDNLMIPESAGTEQLAEECHDDEHQTIAQAVHHAIHQRRPRLVRQGKRFQTAHDDAVGDDESDEDGEQFADVIEIGLQEQIHQYYPERNDKQLYDDADS